MKKRFHIRRGDTVKVNSGNFCGAQGVVLQILRSKSQAIVEGVRMIKKHQRKTQDRPNGAIIEREGPIHISNLELVEKGKLEKKREKSAS